jgi:hypothetical protein
LTAYAAGETKNMMKKFCITVVGAILAAGPAMFAHDVVTGVKDLGKDVDKGAKNTG